MTLCVLADGKLVFTDLQSVQVTLQGKPHSVLLALPSGGIWYSRAGDTAFGSAVPQQMGLDLQQPIDRQIGSGPLDITIADGKACYCLQGIQAAALGDGLQQAIGVVDSPAPWLVADSPGFQEKLHHYAFDGVLSLPSSTRSKI